MLGKKEPISTSEFDKGLFTKGNILVNERGHSPNCVDVKWNFDGSIQKRAGCNSTNSVAISPSQVGGWSIDTTSSLSTSLVSLWNLDEASGTRYDSFGSYDLTDFGGTGSAAGIKNNAAVFSPLSSNYLASNSATAHSVGNNNMSISTWFNLASTGGTVERTIVAKRDLDRMDSYTKLLLHCDGTNGSTTFTDSATGKTVTANGNAQISTAQKEFGTGAALFDGTGDYLTTANLSDWNFGTSEFTFDFWVRFTSLPTNQRLFGIGDGVSGTGIALQYNNGSHIAQLWVNGGYQNYSWSPSQDTWYHIAVLRSAGKIRFYVGGSQISTDWSNAANVTGTTTGLTIGSFATSPSTEPLNGYIDEFRYLNGTAAWTSNFTPPTSAYSSGVTSNYEYYLCVDTANYVSFSVSANGSSPSAIVQATSLGTINTSTWYNAIAWYTSSKNIGLSVNLSVNTALWSGGMKQLSAPLILGEQSGGAAYFDGKIDITAFWTKTMTATERVNLYGGGTGNTINKSLSAYSWGMFDFGATDIRWLIVAEGTGIYASSNMGVNFLNIATSRSATYQRFERSRNVLIATSDAYDLPLYWSGSTGTFASAICPGSAPSAKIAINNQGFLILINTSGPGGAPTGKRFFNYASDSTQLADPWNNAFEFPSSADDEITNAFVVNRVLHVSTRYKLFKVSFQGGNPDWSFIIMKEWGFLPRTVKRVFLNDREWVVGMDWNHRLRAFDGFNEMIISNNVEGDNDLADFSLLKIPFSESSQIINNAEFDPLEQEYRINVALGADSRQTTNALVFNVRTKAMYPYANQQYQCMCVAESNNRQYLLAADRSGFVYILNTGNTDHGTPINDLYTSPFIFNKVPGMVSKGGKLDMFFKPASAGDIIYQDCADFDKNLTRTKAITIMNNGNKNHIYKAIDIPSTHNIFQYILTSSGSTAEPWTLTHYDMYEQGMGVGKGNN